MSVFRVSEMSCNHCEKAMRMELSRGSEDVLVSVDLNEKTVSVENLTDDRVIFLLREIGYNPEKVH